MTDIYCRNKLKDVLNNIYNAIVNLPKPIRRVCYVPVFAFMGWCVDTLLLGRGLVLIVYGSLAGSRFCSMRTDLFHRASDADFKLNAIQNDVCWSSDGV